MYKIIGADWKEYGPISTETVRQWIKEGRATAQTRVQAEGSRDWKALGECAEFADVLPLVAAVLPGSTPPMSPLAMPQVDRRIHGLAVAGLVLGILGFVQCCGPVMGALALVLSIAALLQIKQEPARYKGNDLAIAGIVLAIFGFIITGLLYWFGAAEHLEKLLREMTR
jgi:hypothetical protein